jgi:2-methylisocitrate lyase-like PEP mutase family enzyme
MSESSDLVARARRLRELHAGPELLVLPNVWDAATARTVAAAGFPAVATSSGAVALSLGYADHEQAPPGEMLAAVARVVRAVDVPVTADVESGYGWPAAELVDRLATAGAVGCNLEDTDHAAGGLRDADTQAERIAAVRAAAAASGTDLVVNARVDTFLHPGDPAAQLDEGIRRARRYLEAGADCVPDHARGRGCAAHVRRRGATGAGERDGHAGAPSVRHAARHRRPPRQPRRWCVPRRPAFRW